jgi:predicted Zn-dependent protease
MLKRLGCGVGLVIFLLSTSCIQKNAEGRRSLQLVSSSSLQQQASEVYQDQIKKGEVSKNQRQNKIVQRVGRRIINQAKKMYGPYCAGFQWEVNLLESKEVNAFCMPGGKIAVYTGILKVCENEAALAAIMGHEVAHALLQHGGERMTQAKIVAGTMAAAQMVAKNTDMIDSKIEPYALAALGLGAQVGVMLPFSRAHESEADKMGLRLSAAAGYSPKEAPMLWERMKKLGGGAPMEFMSTHPGHDRRIRDLNSWQMDVKPLYDASSRYGLGDKL